MLDQGRVEKMPTILGPKYSTDWRGKPPHMLKVDIPVWYRFLEKFGNRFKGLWYDSLLGTPVLPPEEEKDPMKKMWRALTSKRSDAIAELENEVWIIEVTDYIGMRALGQLLVYHSLWLEDPPIKKPIKLIVVATAVDHNLIAPLKTYNITTHLV